jgi:hypothetical protein
LALTAVVPGGKDRERRRRTAGAGGTMPEREGALEKEPVRLPDGRRLIFYRFPRPAERPDPPPPDPAPRGPPREER